MRDKDNKKWCLNMFPSTEGWMVAAEGIWGSVVLINTWSRVNTIYLIKMRRKRVLLK